MPRTVPDDELDDALTRWRAHGFAHLPGIGAPAEIDALRARFVALTSGAAEDPGLFFQPESPTGSYADLQSRDGWEGPDTHYRKVDRLDRDPLFWAWIADPLFGRIAARILGARVSLYRAAVFAKAANIGSETPYHQDGGQLWGLDPDPCLQIWTALDDVPADAGRLEVVPQSHAWGLASPRGGLVSEAAVSARQPVPVAIGARAGDVVLLHNLAWHRSGPNRSGSPRRALTVSYLSGATRCTRTRKAPRSFRPVFP